MARKLSELSLFEYDNLKSIGFLFEFYPEATGNWHDDNGCPHDEVISAHHELINVTTKCCKKCGKVTYVEEDL